MITALSSAFSEWMLIFMLFIDGGFGYLITRFAQYCHLQTPCWFCSRLDHVLGKERSCSYWDLICCNHKSMISSLVLFRLHNNAVDAHVRCDSCPSSSETVNKSNTQTHELLVGGIGAESHLLVDQTLLRESLCLEELSVSNGFAQKLLPIKYDRPQAADRLDSPLPVKNTDGEKGIGNTDSGAAISLDDDCADLLFPSIPEGDNFEQDLINSRILPERHSITISEELSSEKLIHQSSVPFLVSEVQLEADRGSASNEVSAEDVDSGSIEINSRQAEHGELISEDLPLPFAITTRHNMPGEPSDATMTGKLNKEMPPKTESDCFMSSEPLLDSKPDIAHTTSSTHRAAPSLDLGDAYKLATSSRVMAVRQLSGKFLKQLSLKGSTQNSEDLKLLLSHFSSSRGIDSSSSSNDTITKPSQLERNESNISLEGSMVSEIEGESMVDRLKRQVEHDRIFMSGLYKELEEERSASAVAANQAMAMITRLQEEKAALQMEALQCLRMMEDQADFDNEALQKANESIAEMEKTIQDLEVELGVYKKKYGDITLLKDIEASCDSSSLRELSLTLDFENEKLYIKRCLEKSEEKLRLFSIMASTDRVNYDTSVKEWVKLSNNYTEVQQKEDFQENSEIEGSRFQLDAMKEKAMPSSQELSALPLGDAEYDEIKTGGESKPRHSAESIDLDKLSNKLSTMTERLKQLEEEYNTIQHSINSLRNGEEGLKFVQEIAGHCDSCI
ncbi:unnamed protein product [Cuscuta europaea]|uniref:GTD-binding domain-containing protein n=1 Tax=Cuscuta europaea TaxID=41803 RepID=A0A9P0ZTT9_CUSEU|nr:unnamed protein product [Cuscuta europaea]